MYHFPLWHINHIDLIEVLVRTFATQYGRFYFHTLQFAIKDAKLAEWQAPANDQQFAKSKHSHLSICARYIRISIKYVLITIIVFAEHFSRDFPMIQMSFSCVGAALAFHIFQFSALLMFYLNFLWFSQLCRDSLHTINSAEMLCRIRIYNGFDCIAWHIIFSLLDLHFN